MGNAKAVVPALLIASALLVAGHYSYSITPAARKGSHSHQRVQKKRKKKTAHHAPKTRKRAVHRAYASGPVYTVTATVYQAVASQTDSQPFVTADNSTIRRGYSSGLHWVAVSRDLLHQWGGRIHYGDKVHLRGVSTKLDGVYTVHDTMHKRHRHRVDILSSPKEKLSIASRNVELQLVKPTALRKPTAKPAKLASHRLGQGRRVASHSVRRHRKRTERPAYLTAAIL